MTQLFRSSRTTVSRVATATGSVIRKEMRGPGASIRRKHETSILRRLADIEGVPKLVADSSEQDSIIVEDAGAVELAELLRTGPVAVDDLLVLAEELARIVAAMHRCGVIHKDINPANIVVAGSPSRPILIDFDLATTFALERPAFTHVKDIVGTLAYLAPEQTGRTGWAVDQRADLYALGATLYEVATGKPPFGDADVLQLVRDHLTKDPVPACEHNPEVPETLSSIIDRLLEKEPERRYQGADGLLHDLGRLRCALDQNESTTFPLGERDFPLRLAPPSRLIGREQETRTLGLALDDAAAGRSRALLVSGAPGVGKTALINQLRPMVTEAGGLFVSGKSDQFRQDAAADALLQVLRRLGRLLLAEPQQELLTIRAQLLREVGANAGLIAAIVPELAAVLDVPTEVDDDPVRAQVRLLQGSLGLLRALASADRPIVIFLDDLQWAGSLLLNVIDAVTTDHGLRGVLLVGSYRDGEVDATHPLSSMMQRWQGLEAAPNEVPLANLPTVEAETLIAEMLRISNESAAALAEEVHPHTDGNPFDTVEYINALRRDGLLDLTGDGWTWDAAAIRHHIGFGDVVTLLTQRITALPEQTQDILRVMSCLRIDVELIELQAASGAELAVSDRAATGVEAALAPALDEGLLVMDQGDSGAVRFRHDRIQQATYDSMAQDERRALHLAIARRLADVSGFKVVAAEQYLIVRNLVTEPSERLRAAELLHHAAGHARLMVNHVLTERFLTAAVDIVEDIDGEAGVHGRLRAQLYLERHSALLGLGQFDEMDRDYAVIDEICDDPVVQADAASAQIAGLMNRGDPGAATELGMGFLAVLGHPVPAADELLAEIGRGLDDLGDWVSSGSAEDDVRRGENPDPRIKAVAKIIDKLVPPAFFAGSPAMPWLVTSAARLWADGGLLPELITPLAHANFVTVALRGDYKTGFATVGRMLAVGEALGFEPQTSTARMLYGLSAAHWFEPLEDCLRTLRRGYEGLVRGGEMMYSGLSFYGLIGEAMECGPGLDEAMVEIDAGMAFTERTGNSYVGAFVALNRQLVRALRGETNGPGEFDDASFDDAAFRADMERNPTASGPYHLVHANAAAVFGDRRALVEHSDLAIAYLPQYETSVGSLQVRFLRALALAGLVAEAGPDERVDLLAELDRYRSWMAERTAQAPANFAHLLALVDAERAAAVGDVEAALRAFDDARHEVRYRRRPWHRALIAERSGRFCLGQGMEHAGQAALSDARGLYLEWGATGKVDQLEDEFPYLKAQRAESFAVAGRTTRRSVDSQSVYDLSAGTVDLLAVLRASQVLSSETNLDGLQERVAELLCGLTGATSTLLLLRDSNQSGWCVPHHDGHERFSTTGAEATDLVPLSVLRYVERTQQALLVEDATLDDRFAHDPYLSDVNTCAILVVPLHTRNEITAMVVLENRNSRAAFGTNRLDTVRLIAGQLLVSLDNALLYGDLERKVADRTQALQEAKDQLELLAVTDALTGLANRRRLTDALDFEWRRGLRSGSPLAIAMVDIDEFKRYNDHYGHPAGDDCLRKVAATMAQNTRDTDVVARYGGEEFAIVLPDTDLTVAHEAAERIRAAIVSLGEPHAPTRNGIVTVSVGVAATVPTPTSTAEQLLKAADSELYWAKSAGRNRVIAAPPPN